LCTVNGLEFLFNDLEPRKLKMDDLRWITSN
jgi:hypothetical protein